MATPAARCQALCDALMDRTVTLAEQDRLGKAIAFLTDRSADYNAATTTVAQKQQFIVDSIRDYVLNQLARAESQMASQAAGIAAAAQARADFGG